MAAITPSDAVYLQDPRHDNTYHEKEAFSGHATHVDELRTVSPEKGGPEDLNYDEEFSYAEQRAIIHRIDRRLVTTCGFMYCISLMDRTNLPAAAIAGMTKQLKLNVGFRYVSVDLESTI